MQWAPEVSAGQILLFQLCSGTPLPAGDELADRPEVAVRQGMEKSSNQEESEDSFPEVSTHSVSTEVHWVDSSFLQGEGTFILVSILPKF